MPMCLLLKLFKRDYVRCSTLVLLLLLLLVLQLYT